eukprot:92277-Chlamydomonas_euryale.AAC.1
MDSTSHGVQHSVSMGSSPQQPSQPLNCLLMQMRGATGRAAAPTPPCGSRRSYKMQGWSWLPEWKPCASAAVPSTVAVAAAAAPPAATSRLTGRLLSAPLLARSRSQQAFCQQAFAQGPAL